MNEYQKLLQRYGVQTATAPRYLGVDKPVDAGDAQGLEDYNADQEAYKQYESGWNQRMNTVGQYGPAWKGETLKSAQYRPKRSKPVSPIVAKIVQDSLIPDQAASSGGGGGGQFYVPEQAARMDTLPVDTGPAAAALGNMGLTGLSDAIASQNNGYGPLSGNLGYSDPRDAAAMGLGVANTAPRGNIDTMGQTATDIQARNLAAQQEQSRLIAEAAATQSAAETARLAQAQAQAAAQEAARQQAAQQAEAAAAAAYQSSRSGGYSGGFGSGGEGAGAATGGNGGDASGGGDRGTRGGFASGGIVQKYADGGLHELNQKYAPPGLTDLADIPSNQGLDISRVSPEQLAMLQEQDPGALQRGVARFGDQPVQALQATQAPVVDPLQALYEKVMSTPSEYATEYEASRKRTADAQERFNKLLEQQMSQQSAGPSKAELYFNLAAAFGAPTKTGTFTESMANASGVLGQHNKAQREADAANRAEAAKLGLTVAQANALAAREEEAGLRQLTAEDMRSKRTMSLEALKEKYKTEQPQSEAGKVAVDSGLKRGTKEYSDFVNSYTEKKLEEGNALKNLTAGLAQQRLDLSKAQEERKIAEGKKLTPGEMKLKTETEDILAQGDQALGDLKKAYALNPKTFDTSLGDRAQRLLLENTQSDHPKVVATREMENLLSKSAVNKLRASFGGNPTEGERKILLDLEGIGAKSVKERNEIILNAFAALKTSKERHAKRLADINAGKYRETTPETAPVEQ